MKKKFILFAVISVFISCKSEKTLDDFNWFLGNWKGTMQEMDVYETWTKINSSSFAGEGYVMSEKDTVFHESSKLQVKDGDIFYIADVPGNPEPVPFKLKSNQNKKAIFENKEHDFPKTITYTQISSDSLIAVVEGDDGGTPRKEEFHFKKTR